MVVDKRYAVIIAAGGSGERFGENKQLYVHHGEEILLKTIKKFQRGFHQVIVVTADVAKVQNMMLTFNLKLDSVVKSGPTRTESVSNGLIVLRDDIDYVFVHDGARPNISFDYLNNMRYEIVGKQALVPVVPIKDSVKKLTPKGLISGTVDRDTIFLVQTPQVFTREVLIAAHAQGFEATDDCGLVEKLKIPIHTMVGDENNIKVTTKADLKYLN